MPRKALRCLVEVDIHAVTCPGVWLPRREDLFVTVTLFGVVRRTAYQSPHFPLLVHQKLRFDKVFYTAYEPAQVANMLDDHVIVLELVQYSALYPGGKVLASYSSSARDFLYPYPSYTTNYGTHDRDILMNRSLDFPGIAPKLEFSTNTIIEETSVPSVYDDGLQSSYRLSRPSSRSGRRSRSRTRSASRNRSGSRNRSTSRSRNYSKGTVNSFFRSRSVSPSLSRQFSTLDLDPEDVDDMRPPFVVRKANKDLISRTPGLPSDFDGKKRRKKKVRDYCSKCLKPVSQTRCTVCKLYKKYTGKRYWGHDRPTQPTHHRHTHTKALNRTPLDFSDEDDEVAGITSGVDCYRPTRSPSPLLYRSSLTDRFDRPFSTSSSSERLNSRVERALRRNRSLERIDPVYSPRYRSYDLDSLDELELDLALARRKRYYNYLY